MAEVDDEFDEQPIDEEMAAQVTRAEEQIVEQSKRIEYYLTDYSVELLALKMEKKDLEIPG